MPHQQRTIYLMSRLNHAIRQRLEEVLRKHDLTAVQYTVLSLLRGREQLSSAEIARRFSVKPQSMNEVIFVLEGKQCITRAEDPENRRVLHVALTAAGRRLLETCDARIDELENRLFARLSANRLGQFRDTTSELLMFVRSAADDSGGESAPALLIEVKPARGGAAGVSKPKRPGKRTAARP